MTARRRDASPPARRRGGFFGWKAGVGILISVVLIYLTFRRMDLRLVLDELRAADPLLLLLSAVAVSVVFWIRAWRWRSILEPVRSVPFKARFAAVCIGFMGNNVFPARVGEFMRAYSLSRMEPVPIVSSFASLVIERLFDGILVISLLFIAMALPSFPVAGDGAAFPYGAAARGAGAVVVVAVIVLLALVLMPQRAVSLFERMVMVLPQRARRPIVDALEAFLTGAGVLRDPGLLLRTGGWTVVLWLWNAVGCWIAFRAFGMDLPFAAAIFLQSAIALAVSVPSAPGFVGPYHAMGVFVLANMWGASDARAGAFAVGFHLVGFIPVTLMGLYYANRLGLSLGEVKHSEEIVEDAVERATGADAVIEGERRSD